MQLAPVSLVSAKYARPDLGHTRGEDRVAVLEVTDEMGIGDIQSPKGATVGLLAMVDEVRREIFA